MSTGEVAFYCAIYPKFGFDFKLFCLMRNTPLECCLSVLFICLLIELFKVTTGISEMYLGPCQGDGAFLQK